MRKNHVWVLLAACLCACAPAPATPSAAVTALVHGVVIDGDGGEAVADGVVLWEGERITAVGPASEVKVPPGARVLDAGGATVLPGFINAHVHAAFNRERLAAWAQGGVTTVRDEAVFSAASLQERLAERDAFNQDPTLARLVSAGAMLAVPGGYGDLYVDSAADARQKALQELDWGADQVKVALEDGYAGRSGLPKLTPDELAAIVQAAHERGARVSGHVTQAAYIPALLDAGVDDIAHVPYDPISPEVIARMVDDGVILIPTFTVFRNYGAPVEECRRNLGAFVAAGGLAALGNDYSGGPGEFELGIPMYEIEQMSAAGMTPAQVIQAATANAARAVGLEGEVGRLAPGLAADILVINGDPLADLQALRDVRWVVHAGRVIR